jgi:hypothetical protein
MTTATVAICVSRDALRVVARLSARQAACEAFRQALQCVRATEDVPGLDRRDEPLQIQMVAGSTMTAVPRPPSD